MHPSWHDQSAETVAARLETHAQLGLSEAEVAIRLGRHGPNRLRERAGVPSWRRLLGQLTQPLVVVLIVSGIVTAALGEWVDALVILGVVAINAWLGFVQEGQAEAALLALAKTLTSEATVVRSGIKQRLSAESLVPGDLVHLAAGDRVPADLRLTEARELATVESALTGESLPARKQSALVAPDVILAERSNMAYAGTTVATGRGAGLVVATGDGTETGRIARALAEAPELETPLTRKMAVFSNWLLLGIGLLALLTFAVGVGRGESAYAMFMAAVALAVGAIPEGLPAAITITLAIGVSRMAKRRAIIRRLPAVETLGSTTVICSDKTGTLTENQMTVREIFAGGRRFAVGGLGYEPAGEIAFAEDCGEGRRPLDFVALHEALLTAVLCNDAGLLGHGSAWRVAGDPTEGALLVVGRKGGIDEVEARARFPRTDELPFDSCRQIMATLNRGDDGFRINVKGAVEQVLRRCGSFAGGGSDVLVLEAPVRAEIEAEALAMAGRGLRVLALAGAEAGAERLDPARLESGLVFLGLVGMLDPPRARAITAVAACAVAGIAVKMITGDHAETARAIAGQLGLDNARVMTGGQIAVLDDAMLAAAVREVSVFARVEPAQKLRLVQALQAQGEVVAMTGDGVNDAPALKAADIGIAMGEEGTEVAKEAAAMVLTDDNFATIEAAVEEGRGVFDNLVKFITWTLPTNFAEGLVIVAAVLAGITLPITPLQILWINMTTAVLLGLSLAFEPVESGIMQRPPRPPDAPLLDSVLIVRMLLVSALMVAGAFGLFAFNLDHGATLPEARTIAMNVFVCCEITYLFNCRSLTRSWIAVGPFENPWVWGGVGAMLVLQLLMTYLPAMNRIFQTAPLAFHEWLEVAAVALAVALVVAGEKSWRMHRGSDRAGGDRPVARKDSAKDRT